MPHIDGLILAGGAGRRMGGLNKGLLLHQGLPLAAWALQRLGPQVENLYISANRNVTTYAALGHQVLRDPRPDLPGPLAGLEAGLRAFHGDILVCVPCDTPDFPHNLVQRLVSGMGTAPAAWAMTDAREHPVFMACRRETLGALEAYLERGERRVGAWLREIGAVPVLFPDETAFANYNTPETLAAAPGRSGQQDQPG